MRRMNNVSSESNTYLQAGLSAGYVCRRAEEELESIGAATGGVVPAGELAEWVGKFLLSKARRSVVHDTKRLPEVRGDSPRGDEERPSPKTIHVQPRRRRSLSISCRECKRKFYGPKNRSKFMKHLLRDHPGVKKMIEDKRKAAMAA